MINFNIPIDKLKHHFVATYVAFVFINLFEWYGFGLTVLGLAVWELNQWWFKSGTPSWKDFLYGLIPAVMFLLTKLNHDFVRKMFVELKTIL